MSNTFAAAVLIHRFIMFECVKRNLFLLVISLLVCLVAAEVVLRWCGYEPAHKWEKQNILLVKPDSFFIKDEHLEWHLGIGVFETYLNNKFVFKSTMNSGRKRVTNFGSTVGSSNTQEQKSKIFTFGCSHAFGTAVPDSSHYPYYLQALLPEFDVQNLSVPAYGLTQMYLYLKQEVESGNKPELAVITYGEWQGERTLLGLK